MRSGYIITVKNLGLGCCTTNKVLICISIVQDFGAGFVIGSLFSF